MSHTHPVSWIIIPILFVFLFHCSTMDTMIFFSHCYWVYMCRKAFAYVFIFHSIALFLLLVSSRKPILLDIKFLVIIFWHFWKKSSHYSDLVFLSAHFKIFVSILFERRRVSLVLWLSKFVAIELFHKHFSKVLANS